MFGAALAQRLRTWFIRGPQPPVEPFPQPTAREREILDGVAAGLTNAQIGQQMYLSAKTVANNVSNILAKLRLAERGQAIVAARDAGLGRRPHGEPEDRDTTSRWFLWRPGRYGHASCSRHFDHQPQ